MNIEEIFIKENISLNNLSTSGSTRQFFELIKYQVNSTRLTQSPLSDFWSDWLPSQLSFYLNNLFNQLTDWSYFLLNIILLYSSSFVDLIKSYQFVSEDYFNFIINKFEFKVFLFLLFVNILLLGLIIIAQKFFKENFEYYTINQDSIKRPSNLYFGKPKTSKPKSN
ncbi:unnamed protein product [Brachionus calyciflorus]|uniref:Transmembrane protein n=1 Tax=Brachionus calyciflorus TaxID=104777 RepID=A0A813QA36_9BILA|nr:unnamed protein product [Brachionus calyciflorus]